MFCGYKQAQDVVVLCLALESFDGSLRWWNPHFYRYVDGISGALVNATDEKIALCVDQVRRLLQLEYGDISWCTALRLVERRWVNGAAQDRVVKAFTLNGISLAAKQ